MPESYLHVRCARRALQKSGVRHRDIPAIVAGAAGPDPLFYYRGLPPLFVLGGRLHRERCGPFLTALVRGADTDLLRSYVLGFLSHNAADATIHPWVAAMADLGSHAALESALDTRCLLRDKGRAMAEQGDGAANLSEARAEKIGKLLCGCIDEVYGVQVPASALGKSFCHFYRLRGWLRDPAGWKHRLAHGAERLFGMKEGLLAGHLQPGDGALALPDHWTDPYTGAENAEDVDALILRAEDLGAELMAAAQCYWDGEIGPLELANRIGSRSYSTGLPA